MAIMRITRLLIVHLPIIALFCGIGGASAQEVKPPATLWTFLGFPPKNTIRDDLTNRNGNRPGLERKPPRLAIADPKNLKSPVPAIKKAAEVKTQEDLAPQKIKAIKYLASIGCGCYNRDGSITEALLAALDDCTETVRLAAADAIAASAGGDCCENCGEHSCCSKEIHDRLMKMAYENNKEGCPIEPSERVRRAAMRALLVCPPHDEVDNGGRELPPGEREPLPGTAPEVIPPAPVPMNPAATSPTPADPALIPATEARIEAKSQIQTEVETEVQTKVQTEEVRPLLKSSRRTAQKGNLAVTEVAGHRAAVSDSPATLPAIREIAYRLPAVVEPTNVEAEEPAPIIVHNGVVDFIDPAKRLVVVRTNGDSQLPTGATVQATHRFLTGAAVVGQLKVVSSEAGSATLQPLNGMSVTKIVRGDQVTVSR
jgi:hypothetical protein